jgi:hypothetical protein
MDSECGTHGKNRVSYRVFFWKEVENIIIIWILRKEDSEVWIGLI